MLEIDKILNASPKELEGLSWYEIVSKLGVLSFNSQGNKPIEIIAKFSRVTAANTILMAGCGAGGTAVHLAEITGARVYGIDISPESIKIANDLAAKSPAQANLHFQIGDAHALTFPPNTFDLVITEFMAFFLQPSAFNGFFRVLKPGGHIALAELVKDPEVNANADAKILAAEEVYAELLGYKFHIPLITEFTDWLGRAGFEQVHVEERVSTPSTREQVKRVGGWKNLFRISKVLLKLMFQSRALRRKFMQMGRVKKVLYQNRSTAKYVFQAILAAQKPG